MTLGLAALLGMSVFAPAAGAQSAEADCRNLPTTPSTSGWTDYAQLEKELDRIERTSRGRVEVSSIGQTQLGHEIYAARVGSGDQVLLVTAEIHGNEKTGPEALLSLLKTLGSSGNPQVQAWLEDVTLVAIPKFNVDGAERNQRQNVFPWADVVEQFPQLEGAAPAWNYNARIGGFDVNRDFNPDLDYEPRAEDLPGGNLEPGFYLTNEARALRDLYVELRDEFGHVEAYVDLHHMGPCNQVDGDGQYVSVALDYPPLGPDDSDKYDAWPALDQERSRRYALAAAEGMFDKAGNGNGQSSPFFGGVTRYLHPEWRDLPGQARSSFALNGTSTVLFEVRGQQQAWGQKQKGMLTAVVEAGLVGIVERMADGSIEQMDGDDFYELPTYGWDQ
ncbi:hypothetical protein GCM10011354_30150 [Egicoccus halophilus]|uniref:Peptidase M14 domain-containing protein n=1 Tax=Egicoccus halophilus TaxID=1670830 RepID=A0A8J3EV85_9ACTN|nr:hypothetical protein GCM10011354_30150 [Egicoccus halophilus]